MDLTSLETVKYLCEKYKIRPSRQKGQNFLIDRNVLDRIVKTADLKKDDVVLEIGPGFGVLTRELARRVKRVVAIELDKRMISALNETLTDCKNVEIVNEDALKFSGYNLQKYKLVANLPYNITSAVLRKFLSEDPNPSEMVLMVQKEVAERIVAGPGKMSLLSVSAQFFSHPEIVSMVPAESFSPKPAVDSSIVKISIDGVKAREVNEKAFFKVVKIGFSSRRKQLQNNLAAGLKISKEKAKELLIKAGFDERVRAQDLSIGDWITLVELIRAHS